MHLTGSYDAGPAGAIAEVFTVIGEWAVVCFAYPRARPPGGLAPLEPWRQIGHDARPMPGGKAGKRNLIHRPSAQPARKPCVMHNPAELGIDPVVGVTVAQSDDVRTCSASPSPGELRSIPSSATARCMQRLATCRSVSNTTVAVTRRVASASFLSADGEFNMGPVHMI